MPLLLAMAIAITSVPLILVSVRRSGMFTAALGLIGSALQYVSNAPSYRGSTKAKSAPLICVTYILVCLEPVASSASLSLRPRARRVRASLPKKRAIGTFGWARI